VDEEDVEGSKEGYEEGDEVMNAPTGPENVAGFEAKLVEGPKAEGGGGKIAASF
jgi:hypothetical protein